MALQNRDSKVYAKTLLRQRWCRAGEAARAQSRTSDYGPTAERVTSLAYLTLSSTATSLSVLSLEDGCVFFFFFVLP